MATTENTDIAQEIPEELQEELEEDSEDIDLDKYELSSEAQEEYGAPVPDEKHNQWSIINDAIKRDDTVKTTYLSQGELGMPMFSVRFYLDMEDLAYHYLTSIGLSPEQNKIAQYFRNKVLNITDSGLSNKGFVLVTAVTQKRETTRTRKREVMNNANKK